MHLLTRASSSPFGRLFLLLQQQSEPTEHRHPGASTAGLCSWSQTRHSTAGKGSLGETSDTIGYYNRRREEGRTWWAEGTRYSKRESVVAIRETEWRKSSLQLWTIGDTDLQSKQSNNQPTTSDSTPCPLYARSRHDALPADRREGSCIPRLAFMRPSSGPTHHDSDLWFYPPAAANAALLEAPHQEQLVGVR